MNGSLAEVGVLDGAKEEVSADTSELEPFVRSLLWLDWYLGVRWSALNLLWIRLGSSKGALHAA